MNDKNWRNYLNENWMEVLMAGQEFLIPSLVVECGKISYRLSLDTMLTFERVFAQFRGQYKNDQEFEFMVNKYGNEQNQTSQMPMKTNKVCTNSNMKPDNELKELYDFHIEAIAVKLRTEFHSLSPLADYTWVDKDQVIRLIKWFYRLKSFEPQLLFQLVVRFVENRLVTEDMTLAERKKLYQDLDECFEEGYLETDLLTEMHAKGMLLKRRWH